MDKLLKCAKAFEKLLDTQYHIIIGRKGKAVELRIVFEAAEFYHLVGLHKLVDLHFTREKRRKTFADILSGKISLSDIKQSSSFDKIQNRLEPFADIESLFDKNNLIFRYNEKAHSFSHIQAEYLLSTPYKDTDIYFFLDKKEPPGQYFCRSFFPRESKDYTLGQTVYTLLFKEKISVRTGERAVQYNRL